MQVSVGEEGPGYMPWNGSRESWVGWCYPYPRPVQVVNIATAAMHALVHVFLLTPCGKMPFTLHH